MRRIQCLPTSIAIPALYCLLDIMPLEQELDLRSLTLLANALYTDGTLEQDITMRQISVKDLNSHSWVVACNERLHKYSLPNIYTVKQLFSSETEFKQQVKSSLAPKAVRVTVIFPFVMIKRDSHDLTMYIIRYSLCSIF